MGEACHTNSSASRAWPFFTLNLLFVYQRPEIGIFIPIYWNFSMLQVQTVTSNNKFYSYGIL